jgi:hypothetical protein
MSKLHSAIEHLATQFVSAALSAVRNAPLEDIQGLEIEGKPARPGRGAGTLSGGRLARRSDSDIAGTADRIVGLLKKHRGGLNAEKVRAELGIAKKEWARPLAKALASKKIRKTGQKRATTYFAR